MAGVYGVVTAENFSCNSSSIPMTIAQIVAGTNHRVVIKAWRIFFEGTTSTNAPVEVRFLRQSNATGSGAAITVEKKNSADDETLVTTAISCSASGSQPTNTGNPLFIGRIHPQGNYGEMVVFDNPIIVPGGTRLGILLTAPNTVEATITVDFEE
jgi:hypothetical protein